MRTRFLLLSLAIPLAVVGSAAQVKSTGSPLIGSWRLVSQDERRADGTVIAAWGPHPGGRLIYDASSRMAVQLMNPQRKPFAASDHLAGTAEEIREAFGGYIAYYGSYSVDPDARVVVHHVEGSLYPNWIGTDLRRSFLLVGDRLELSTPPMLVGGRTSTFVLAWQREGQRIALDLLEGAEPPNKGMKADEAWSTSELRSLSPVFGTLGKVTELL